MYGIDVTDSKFKVGDKVRVVKTGWQENGEGSYHCADIGDTDEVIAVDLNDPNPYEGKHWLYKEHEIELSPEGPKFKIGDVVRVIDDRGGGKIGDIGQVTDVNKDGTGYELLGIPAVKFLYEERLELAPDCAERKVEQDNAPVKPQPKFKAGDVVRCLSDNTNEFTKGKEYVVRENPNRYGHVGVVKDDRGQPNGWGAEYFELASAAQPCIITRVDNGKPLPSRYPHVHASVADATAEAERLARNNPGTEFAVYQRVAGRVAEVSYKMKEVA